MKIIFTSVLLHLASLLLAQAGINTMNPHPSTALDISSASKGVSLPVVALTGKNDVATIPVRKESLLLYNTNNVILGNKGYYFWDGSKWDYFFSELNQTNLLNQIQYYSASSASAINFTRAAGQFKGYMAHVAGETLDPAQWTEVPGLTKTVTVTRPTNNFLMNANGMFQANNGPSDNTSGIATSIGFFIDDKLVDVKPLFLDFQAKCSYRQFTTYGYANNVSVGTHTVKFAIRNISSPNISTLSVTYGGPNTSCSPQTVSSFEGAFSSVVTIFQPYAF